ncbi:TPA: hypothetical protein RNX00_002152 [Pasteurella multocida]|nr:hypothetical protein [Pasteurella multocida]
MEKTGIFVNGKFIECDVSNLEILIKGKIENLNVANKETNILNGNSHTSMYINQVGQQVFYGNITGGTFEVTHNSNSVSQAIKTSSIKINVEGDINNLTASTGDVYCKNTGTIETVSGDVTISGNVSGTVKSISGDIRVKGNVSGNVNTVSGDLFTK